MKRLNITKEQFEKSRYFKDKYGTLEYVSESGKAFKTSKGKVLMFKEGVNGPGSKDRDPNPQPEDWDWVHDRVAKKLTRKIARELGSKFRSAAARDDADYIAIGFAGSIYDSPKAKAIIEKVKNMYPEQLVFSGISTLNRGKGEVTFEVNKEYVFDLVGSKPAMESSKKLAKESGRKFVKESTGDMVEVKAVISGAGETVEEALDNFKNELISMDPDGWGEWTNCGGDGGDKEWWIQQYYKWNEENGGDVDMKVLEDDGDAPVHYARVDIRNTTY